MPKVKSETSVKREASSKKEIESPKVEAKVAKPKKVAEKVNLNVDVYNLQGEVSGKFELPTEVFGQKVNKALLSQAIRVYQNNRAGMHGHTKTRGEVAISTRKIYKQKGTGGARHGAKSAPLFVGGGVSMGPRVRSVVLELPKKMQKAALVSALSEKVIDGQVLVIEGLDQASGKTKEMAGLVKKLGAKKLCLVTEGTRESLGKAFRASGNIKALQYEIADNLSLLKVLHVDKLFFTREALTKLSNRLANPDKIGAGKESN